MKTRQLQQSRPTRLTLACIVAVVAISAIPHVASSQPISDAPELLAPDDMVTGQPRNLTFYWSAVDAATGYVFEASATSDLSDAVALSSDTDSLSFVDTAIGLTDAVYWRVRGINESNLGPWSDVRSLTLSTDTLQAGDSGPLTIEESFMFVEVDGPDDRYACGSNAGSLFGCPEVGGNVAYQSFNGSGEYIMYREGLGTEDVIGPFGPNDFEIRFTETGSFAYHAFSSGKVSHVPFEVWDIGPTYTGTSVNPNDPSDDVRMIPILLAGTRSIECEWFFDPAGGDPFGTFDGSTQRVYAYYPTESYEAWDAAVRPLVDGDPDGCPAARDLTDGAVEEAIDFDRGRPIQRTIFIGDSASDPPHPAFGVVVRFYTREPLPPSTPVHSAPAPGTMLEQPATLWWNGPPGPVNYRLEVTASGAVVVDTMVSTARFELTGLSGGAGYEWRVRARTVHGQSDWSIASSFSVVSGVGAEEMGRPGRLVLRPNYPNPARGVTTLSFDLPAPAKVELSLYDVLGRRVRQLANGYMPAGRHDRELDISGLSDGVYVYRLKTRNTFRSGRMIVIR